MIGQYVFDLPDMTKPNKNNRVYPDNLPVGKEVNLMMGYGDNDLTMDLEKIAGKATILEDNKVSVRLYDTPMGNVAKDMFEENKDDFAILSAGVGQVDYKEEGPYLIKDYELTYMAIVPKGDSAYD